MYCHYFHVVLSDGDFFFARMIFHVHVSSLTWWPCLPISFLFFIGTCSTFLGMCACIQLSLVGLLVMSSRHLSDMMWSGVLLIILLFSEIFILIGKYRPYEHCVPPQQPDLPLALCTAVATTYGSASVGTLQKPSELKRVSTTRSMTLSLRVLKYLWWCIRHHCSVEKSAELDKFGLSAGPHFDSGQNPVNSNQYGFEQIDPQARVPNYCFQ